MSPIFVRPVREQLEHDRLIRFLQLKYKRKFEALINVGEERIAPVKIGTGTFFPDLVLLEGKKVAGVIEVETGESVNNLEVMAQWVHFAKAKVPFHLYVPVTGYDSARRLWESYKVRLTEVWTYRPAAEGFDLVRMWHDAAAVAASTRAANATARAEAAARPAPAGKAAAAVKPPVVAQTRGRDVEKAGREACEARKNGEARLHEGCQAGESPRQRGQKACEEGHARLTQEVGCAVHPPYARQARLRKSPGHARLSFELARGRPIAGVVPLSISGAPEARPPAARA